MLKKILPENWHYVERRGHRPASYDIMLVIAVLASTLTVSGFQSGSMDLISTPGKSTATCKWSPFEGKVVTNPALGNATVYVIKGGPYDMDGMVEGVSIIKPPTSRRLKFSIAMRGSTANQTYGVVAVGMNPQLKTTWPWTSEWEMKGSLRADGWTTVQRDLVVPADTGVIRLVIHNPNKEAIFMSAPHMTVGAEAEPDAEAIALAKKDVALAEEERAHPSPSPAQKLADKLASQEGVVVAHIQLRAPICTKKAGETGIATFPVPELGPGQVPLAFKVECLAPGKLLGYSWKKRKDGRNLVCDVKIQPGTKGAWVQYEALVLLGGDTSRDMNPPATSAEWTQSTACVQATDPQISAIEKKLALPGDSTEAYAQKVFSFVRDDMGKGAPFKALDAVAALQCGGSCTNKANLSAALLRAHGIPARTVAHMPTWCSSKLYEHWLTEFWQTGKGWIALDAALGRWEPDRRTRVIIAVSNPADEDRAFEPLHERFVMPGAAYQSVLELTPTLYPADLADDDAINSVDQVGRFGVSGDLESKLFKAAGETFVNLYGQLAAGKPVAGRYAKVLAAAKSGRIETLLRSIEH